MRSGMKRSLRRAEAVLLWPRVAGVEVAGFSSARAVRDGVLYVDVDDSETAMHLSLQRRRFLAVYHDTYKVTDVKEIRFQAGRAARGARGEAGASGRGDEASLADTEETAPDPQALARLARELGDLGFDEDVTGLLLTAGRSLLALRARQRSQGYTECPACGALHPGLSEEPTPREVALQGRDTSDYELPDRELCEACRRYALDGKVRAAASDLALDPVGATPLLSEPERAVAGRLAVAALELELRATFAQALADPGYRVALRSLVLRLAGLITGKAPGSLTDADLEVVEPRYRRFLDLDDPLEPQPH